MSAKGNYLPKGKDIAFCMGTSQVAPHALNGDVHRVLAFVCFRREQREQGSKHLKRAISIYKQHELLSKLDEVSQHYSQYLADQNRKDEALEECMKYRQFLVETLGKRGIVL